MAERVEQIVAKNNPAEINDVKDELQVRILAISLGQSCFICLVFSFYMTAPTQNLIIFELTTFCLASKIPEQVCLCWAKFTYIAASPNILYIISEASGRQSEIFYIG